jgi:hypothetical protein
MIFDYYFGIPPGGGHSQTLLFDLVSKKYQRFWLFDQTHIHPWGRSTLGFLSGLCMSSAGGGGGAAAVIFCA